MLYLATASNQRVRDAMSTGELGQMVTPDEGKHPLPGVPWALDNGCFSARWTPERWLATLARHQHVPGCLFAVVPDVVADADATDHMWSRWVYAVVRHGYRPAYVLQNGCRGIPLGARAAFIGGDDAFKLGPDARTLVAEAKSRRMWVHMGRVNSQRRLRYATSIGCDSVDGTFLAFGPDTNLVRLRRYLRRAGEPTLWEAS